MEELRIPTDEIKVLVYTDQSTTLAGCLYVTALSTPLDRVDQVLTVLNDERVFVPFRVDDDLARTAGDVALNKEHIVRVRVAVESGREQRDGEALAPCTGDECSEVELSDGSHLVGRLVLAAPAAASRLVDKLNQTQRFIPIISDGAVDLVHCRHVLCMK